MLNLKRWINFKNPLDECHLLYCHPSLIVVLASMSMWAKSNHVPFIVTSVIRSKAENDALGSKSLTHVEGRAADISVKGWSATDVDLFERDWNANKLNTYYGAISSTDYTRKLVVVHGKGDNLHIHVQVKGD